MDLKDKVIIVTGASSGIGKAIAYELGFKKSKVVLAARRIEKLKDIEAELKTVGIEVFSCPTDVSKEADCKNLIEKTIERFGTIDVLINNAGISMRAMFADTELDVLRRVMDVNFWGTVMCTKYAMPHLTKSKGTVIGVSSVAGYRGLPGRTGYSASKFAMHGFLEALRTENYNTGVNVLLICPGFTASEIRETALVADGSQQGKSPKEEDKMMTAEEVAKEVIKSIENNTRDKVLTRQGKMTVMVNKLMPSFMDKMVFNHFKKEDDSPLK